MYRIPSMLLCLAVMGLTGASPMAARAAQPRVDDKAGFFSPETVSKVNGIVQQIKQQSGRDLVVETYPSIPDELQDRFRQEGKSAFFPQWLGEQAKAQGVNGVMVLITKDPAHLEVGEGNVTAQSFPPAARQDARHSPHCLS